MIIDAIASSVSLMLVWPRNAIDEAEEDSEDKIGEVSAELAGVVV